MKNTKGQAAIEFLMTYGWAIMTVLGVVGVLLYFNFLNPSLLLPDKCELGYRLSCNDFLLKQGSPDGTFQVSTSNIFPDEIVITFINVSNSHYPDTYCALAGIFTLKQGNTTTIPVICSNLNQITERGKLAFDVKINYYFQNAGPTYSYDLYGKLYTKIER
ncbi:MAG TPA: hypothetical protein VJB90_05255 [Candidatus Nanoarchaeia archaeon]|nr:hypothetical protein [Candidatus Nanoarchaeia archaeon]